MDFTKMWRSFTKMKKKKKNTNNDFFHHNNNKNYCVVPMKINMEPVWERAET